MKFLSSLFVFLILHFGSIASAGLIVSWDVAGVDVEVAFPTNPHSFSATTSDANASGTLSLGAGVNPSTTAGQYGFKVSAANAQTSLAGAIANNHFLEFSVDVGAGYRLNLESIEFNAETSSSGADDVAFMTSIDGFSDGDEIETLSGRSAVGTGDLDTDGTGFGGPFDLSAAQYQNLTGTVSFRLYGFNTGSGAGVTYIRNLEGDDLVVNGTLVLASIPEPTSAVLFGSALLLGCNRRRR
jgi:hypothetical protein